MSDEAITVGSVALPGPEIPHLVDTQSRRRRSLPVERLISMGKHASCEIRLDVGHAGIATMVLAHGVIFLEAEGRGLASFATHALSSFHAFVSWDGLAAWRTLLPDLEEVSDAVRHPSYARALEATQLRACDALKGQAHVAWQQSDATERAVLAIAVGVLSEEMWREGSIRDEPLRRLFLSMLWSIWAHVCRFGVLTRLLLDPEVNEVMAIEPGRIYVEVRGNVKALDLAFGSEQEMLAIIERMASMAGRRIDESRPWCDARLPDGSRVHAITPPLALNGPCLTIRKFVRERMAAHDLVARGSASEHIVALLASLVGERRNVLVSGGTGTGKTTLLNILSSFIGPDERIITIEDSAELQLRQPHVVRLEARPANTEGRGEVALRELVRNALRMRPDRIIVGECRGGEALDMLQAMNTGHEGSMTTIHANSAPDALKRLETLVMFASSGLPLAAVREQIAGSVHVVVQLARVRGKRFVSRIDQVKGICPTTGGYETETLACWTPPPEREP